MRVTAIAIAGLVSLSSCRHAESRELAASTARGGQDVVAITHVTVVNVGARDAAGATRPDQTVLIVGGRITEVDAATRVDMPAGARVVDGRGKYLIPGLWDAHAHVTAGGEPALAAYIANGVTTVRDLGGRLPELHGLRREIRTGTRVGPRLLLAGPNLEGAWWLDRVVGFLASDSTLRGSDFLERSPRYRIASPADAPAAVDSLIRLGVDLIKFRNLRGDEFRAIAAEARRRGIFLAGHAPVQVSIGEAADAGLRSFEHSETVMIRLGDAPDSVRRAELARVARAGSAITPTLVADVAYRQTPDSVAYAVIADSASAREPRRRYLAHELLTAWKFGLYTKRFERPRTAESWAELHRRQVADTRVAHAMGVPLLVGTDLGVSLVYPGFSVHDELRLLVDEVGLIPLEALRAATLAPARTMGMADSLGVVAPGKVADLVLLDADPLRDVRNTRRIGAVVVGGRLLRRDDLDRLLEEAARSAIKPLQSRR
jgi:imidazolonepropionase-like amidohydrolase